ncbi:hypothetical protein, variant [Capsaspora owczarzaki ATCC 30864]|uniref:Uncharacterized protein n=1 Tax=Capsaspora owczarzaki (strain ATCC 30864) TaxID=595528 RepID=A0A0D2WHU6_CAPO3|nr:hypothetical protein, variant [Capsaspora owczarzaki ATCC 30864]
MQSTAAELLLRSSRVAATAVSASPRSVRSSSITPRSSARVGPAAVARAFTSTPCSHPRLSLSPSAALAARLPSPQLRAQSYSSSSSPAPAQAPPSSAEANNKVTTTTTATAAATNGNALATVDAATNADEQATKNPKDASTQADAPTTKKPNFFKRFQIGLLDLTRKTPALPPSASMLKPFEASTTLSHSKYAVKFPSRVLTAINGQTVDLSEAFTRGISIVSVAFDQFGALRNASFTHEFRSQYGSNPYVNDFEILMNRMPMMRVLQPMFNRNLLAAIPQQRHVRC